MIEILHMAAQILVARAVDNIQCHDRGHALHLRDAMLSVITSTHIETKEEVIERLQEETTAKGHSPPEPEVEIHPPPSSLLLATTMQETARLREAVMIWSSHCLSNPI